MDASHRVLKFDLLDAEKKKIKSSHALTESFLGSRGGWGRPKAFAHATLEQDTYYITAPILRDDGKPAAPSVPTDFAPRLFNNAEYSDVLFNLETVAGEPASQLIALRLLLRERSPYLKTLISSGFREAKALSRFNPAELVEPDDTLIGDGDDFVVFDSGLSRKRRISKKCKLAVDGGGDDTMTSVAERMYDAGDTDADTQTADETQMGQYAKVKQVVEKKGEGDGSEGDKQIAPGDPDARPFLTIHIKNRSYVTYHALLYYLHAKDILFTPSISNDLVKQYEAKAKDAGTLPDDKNTWLIVNALRDDPPPCNLHALYCLADEYLEDELRGLAKDFIVRSLTVENVAYEAFCVLSMDYDDSQQPVVKFLLDNWVKVRDTKASNQVVELLEAGKLPGGGAVFKKIFAGLV